MIWVGAGGERVPCGHTDKDAAGDAGGGDEVRVPQPLPRQRPPVLELCPKHATHPPPMGSGMEAVPGRLVIFDFDSK